MSKKLAMLIFALFFILLLAVPASANSAEPPGMTIIVEGAPADMSLTLELPEEGDREVYVQKAQKKWETYFYLYYPFDSDTLDGALIRVESGEKSFSCPLPESAYIRYNTLFTLNFETQTMTSGQRWWRQPALTAVRITLTLLVEGLIFFVFGFRSKRSWIVFLIVNIVTQGWLNYIINSSAFSRGYWIVGLYLAEFVIFLAESIVFPMAVKEKKKLPCVLYTFIANAASLAVGLLLINQLPI